jgi:hypothetical protein
MDETPRWLYALVAIAALAGVVIGVWLFGALT